MLKFILLIAIMGCMGCGSVNYYSYHKSNTNIHISNVRTIPVWIDNSFNEKQINKILWAVDEWNLVLNGYIKIEFKSYFNGRNQALLKLTESNETGLGWIIVNVNSEDPIMLGMNPVEKDGMLAFVRGANGHVMIIVGDHLGNRNLKNIVMHEMGHLMGALHVRSQSLMYPEYGWKQENCIDKITVSQVADYNGIKLEDLNYCVIPGFE